jgi:AcrR family transcriptional regulator
MTEEAARPLRADARRNREKILAAAVRVFAEEGLDAHLERIAKEAGVGSATLYRNFPTREALVEAVYRNEVAQLCDAAPALLAEKPPLEALHDWTRLFLDYVTVKYGVIDALRTIAASGHGNPYGHSRELIWDALRVLMDACVAAGVIRADIGPDDLGTALEGIALTSSGREDRARAERLLDLTLDGLRADR